MNLRVGPENLLDVAGDLSLSRPATQASPLRDSVYHKRAGIRAAVADFEFYGAETFGASAAIDGGVGAAVNALINFAAGEVDTEIGAFFGAGGIVARGPQSLYVDA